MVIAMHLGAEAATQIHIQVSSFESRRVNGASS